jgi:hypothetical protein
MRWTFFKFAAPFCRERHMHVDRARGALLAFLTAAQGCYAHVIHSASPASAECFGIRPHAEAIEGLAVVKNCVFRPFIALRLI